MPQAVARALEQEIAALGEEGRALAQGAAVAGDPVDLDLAVGRRRSAARRRRWARWTSCSRAALLVGTDVPRRYRFRHPLVRHAIYASAADGWRIAAHARAAAALSRARRLDRRSRAPSGALRAARVTTRRWRS